MRIFDSANLRSTVLAASMHASFATTTRVLAGAGRGDATEPQNPCALAVRSDR